MGKIRINLELIKQIMDLKIRINSASLQDIEFIRDGKPVAISPKEIEEWRFTGLSNFCFAEGLVENDDDCEERMP